MKTFINFDPSKKIEKNLACKKIQKHCIFNELIPDREKFSDFFSANFLINFRQW